VNVGQSVATLCVIITCLEVYVCELPKFGVDKRVVNDSLSVCFCVLIQAN